MFLIFVIRRLPFGQSSLFTFLLTQPPAHFSYLLYMNRKLKVYIFTDMIYNIQLVIRFVLAEFVDLIIKDFISFVDCVLYMFMMWQRLRAYGFLHGL